MMLQYLASQYHNTVPSIPVSLWSTQSNSIIALSCVDSDTAFPSTDHPLCIVKSYSSHKKEWPTPIYLLCYTCTNISGVLEVSFLMFSTQTCISAIHVLHFRCHKKMQSIQSQMLYIGNTFKYQAWSTVTVTMNVLYLYLVGHIYC